MKARWRPALLYIRSCMSWCEQEDWLAEKQKRQRSAGVMRLVEATRIHSLESWSWLRKQAHPVETLFLYFIYYQ